MCLMFFLQSDMCIKTMANKAKRKSMKFGSTLRWRPFRVPAEEGEALKPRRTTTVKATVRKYPRREHRRTQHDRLFGLWKHEAGEEKTDFLYEESPAACVHRHPAGAMAPENTTQYLMGNVYEDFKIDINQSVRASHEEDGQQFSECIALDSECYLAFQQRNFEEAFEMFW